MCHGCYMGKPDPERVAEIEASWDNPDDVENSVDFDDDADGESCTDE